MFTYGFIALLFLKYARMNYNKQISGHARTCTQSQWTPIFEETIRPSATITLSSAILIVFV